MKLDYYTLICPEPIKLSIGTIKHPTLREIGKLTYARFGYFQVCLKLTPRNYYKYLDEEDGEDYWNCLSDEQKSDITLYDLILLKKDLRDIYLEIFNFFFVERVIFVKNLFWIIDTDDYTTPTEKLPLTYENIRGIINPKTFYEVLNIIQQIICIDSDDILDEQAPKFKNKIAQKMFEEMLKANEEKKKREEKEVASNFSLPNLISKVAAKSENLNIVNIWDATLFQLYDQFRCIQNDDIYYINRTRVAVWGDEENKFDPSLWYKNNFDKDNKNSHKTN